jgi:hypothetical protein
MKKLVHSLFACLALCQGVHAVTINGSVGGAPIGVNYLNFNDLVPNTTGVMVTNGPNGSATVMITPNGQVATGSSTGFYAAPFLSGGNGTAFGTPNGLDATPYRTSGSIGGNGSVTLTFGAPQQYFGLLWGSIDPDNRLDFYDSSNKLVATILGSDVTKSANGDQGVNGTLYVNINELPAFTSVKATSPNYAFEFDNVSYSARPISVADGGKTLGLLGLGLLGIVVISRRLSSRQA